MLCSSAQFSEVSFLFAYILLFLFSGKNVVAFKIGGGVFPASRWCHAPHVRLQHQQFEALHQSGARAEKVLHWTVQEEGEEDHGRIKNIGQELFLQNQGKTIFF